MREDMDRVVIERPRHRSWDKHHYYRKHANTPGRGEELNDLPKKQGMRRPYGWNGKDLSDFLNPLRRYLEAQVGRPWNKVYSEIRERLNPRSTTQIHIMTHVEQYVADRTFVAADGKVYFEKRYWGAVPLDDWPGQLYVNPKTGLLCQTPWRRPAWRRKKEPADITLIELGQERELRKIDGVWYWMVFADVPKAYEWIGADGKWHQTRTGVMDVLGSQVAAPGRYRAGKRQASARDLRKHGLVNDLNESA